MYSRETKFKSFFYYSINKEEIEIQATCLFRGIEKKILLKIHHRSGNFLSLDARRGQLKKKGRRAPFIICWRIIISEVA